MTRPRPTEGPPAHTHPVPRTCYPASYAGGSWRSSRTRKPASGCPGGARRASTGPVRILTRPTRGSAHRAAEDLGKPTPIETGRRPVQWPFAIEGFFPTQHAPTQTGHAPQAHRVAARTGSASIMAVLTLPPHHVRKHAPPRPGKTRDRPCAHPEAAGRDGRRPHPRAAGCRVASPGQGMQVSLPAASPGRGRGNPAAWAAPRWLQSKRVGAPHIPCYHRPWTSTRTPGGAGV